MISIFISMELIGWLGSLMMAFCAAPQAFKSYKSGNSHGISSSFLWIWFWGEFFTLFYILFAKFSIPLIVNYSVNIVFIFVIIWYHYMPREVNDN